jgi:nicotinate-nucleotide adenylyltransferase
VQLELEKVLFVPMGQPPHREIELEPGADARVEMCELAIAGAESFRVSRLELDRDGPSYTVDTLRALREESPDDELVLILGGDQAADLGSWHEPEEILRLVTVAAVDRTGWARERIEVKIAPLRGSERMVFFDMPRIDVSSTLVRHRAGRGQPIRYLVPDAVAEYIVERRLYRTPVATR